MSPFMSARSAGHRRRAHDRAEVGTDDGGNHRVAPHRRAHRGRVRSPRRPRGPGWRRGPSARRLRRRRWCGRAPGPQSHPHAIAPRRDRVGRTKERAQRARGERLQKSGPGTMRTAAARSGASGQSAKAAARSERLRRGHRPCVARGLRDPRAPPSAASSNSGARAARRCPRAPPRSGPARRRTTPVDVASPVSDGATCPRRRSRPRARRAPRRRASTLPTTSRPAASGALPAARLARARRRNEGASQTERPGAYHPGRPESCTVTMPSAAVTSIIAPLAPRRRAPRSARGHRKTSRPRSRRTARRPRRCRSDSSRRAMRTGRHPSKGPQSPRRALGPAGASVAGRSTNQTRVEAAQVGSRERASRLATGPARRRRGRPASLRQCLASRPSGSGSSCAASSLASAL